MEGLCLGPVVGNVVEVLGIGGDLLKDAPRGFDVGQVLFALILSAPLVEQAVLAPDAFQGAVAEGQIELADEATGPEGGQLAAQSQDLLLQFWGSLVGMVMRGAGTCDEAARSVLLITSPPLADRGHGGVEEAGGGLDADLTGRLDQA
jgi:hypothetical protein